MGYLTVTQFETTGLFCVTFREVRALHSAAWCAFGIHVEDVLCYTMSDIPSVSRQAIQKVTARIPLVNSPI